MKKFFKSKKKVFVLSLVVLSLITTGVFATTSCNVTFQRWTSGQTYTRSMANTDFGRVTWLTGGDRLKIADYNGWNHLRIQYPAGRIGSQNSGGSFKAYFDPGTEYTAEYRVRFESDFDWSRGGKLPGLCGGSAPTGGKDTIGDGFSARFMWRENGTLHAYLYNASGGGQYVNANYTMPRNEWVHIKQRIKLNTGNNSNGILQVWVNGDLKINLSNVRWVNRNSYPDAKIDMFYFSTFFGGSTVDWAPSRTVHARFDDFIVNRIAQ